MPIISYKGKTPNFSSETCFVAKSATLSGDVSLGEECSIWFNAVLRAEVAPIRIGARSNVQDNSVIHTDLGYPVAIGEGVSVGHSAVVHGASVGSNCLIGMGAVLLNGSEIGDDCVLAAGSLLPQNKKIPDGSLAIGSPAVLKRKLEKEEIDGIRTNALHYKNFRADYLKTRIE
ncbi:MAG TPA: gamma carbonic anhydrase family protein [Nitrososphaerales archaeon]|nr:gamma carbonic anhydrase family protein [Nitrososphaerales archaeon]